MAKQRITIPDFVKPDQLVTLFLIDFFFFHTQKLEPKQELHKMLFTERVLYNKDFTDITASYCLEVLSTSFFLLF
ncbi:hypothetical protein [Aquimarina longa]|uniref:hypothetical protein n=1 Tax=Aquimarina longa TaxID=1080221 RepID=UPI000780CC5F